MFSSRYLKINTAILIIAALIFRIAATVLPSWAPRTTVRLIVRAVETVLAKAERRRLGGPESSYKYGKLHDPNKSSFHDQTPFVSIHLLWIAFNTSSSRA